LVGLRRNSMISRTSSLASSTPATSSKVTPGCSRLASRARLLPKDRIPPPPMPRSCLNTRNQSTITMIRIGRTLSSRPVQKGFSSSTR